MKGFRSALVSGATGFIGSALVRRLLAEKIEVTCLMRARSRDSSQFGGICGATVIEVSSFQTAELKSALTRHSAELIFNLASYGVHQDDRNSDKLIEGNVGVLTHLLEATSDWPLRKLIHTGSGSEYGFPQSEHSLISETDPLRPNSLYGAAKAASFLYGRALASGLSIPLITLRLFGVFGPGEAPQRLVPYLIQRLQHDEPVDLTPGEQVRDFLYIDDVIEAFLTAAREERLKAGQAYNVCSGEPVRVREIGEAVADALHKPRHLLHWGKRPYRNDEPMWLVGDNSRFRQATSWRPQVSLAEGIRRMIESGTPEAATPAAKRQ